MTNQHKLSVLNNQKFFSQLWWLEVWNEGISSDMLSMKTPGITISLSPSSCFSSVAQSCPTLCDPMNCSTPGLPITNSWSLLKLMSIKLMMPSNHVILSCPLLFLPSIFPSIRVFSNESLLRIRWPNYWSFSFNISPSNDYSGLISFRIDWLDLLVVQGTFFRVLSNITVHQFFGAQLSWWFNSHIQTWLLEKP